MTKIIIIFYALLIAGIGFIASGKIIKTVSDKPLREFKVGMISMVGIVVFTCILILLPLFIWHF